MTYIKPRPDVSRLAARGAATLLAALLAASTAWAQPAPQNLPKQPLGAGMHIIQAQIARTPEQREIGLMFRKEMPAHEGMLFVFEQPATQCFWMRNTLLPLSTAFVADDGVIVNIEDMAPMTENSHCSTKPVRYVLEMNKGWFAKVGYKAGSRLTGAPFSK
ncbi:MAG TPA: DUF192 domain-containing protein [Ideonella sp.]|nr:DUF192 domain-containing protein [Ideonella sp.]